MDANVFAKFNSMFDVDGLKSDIESAASNSGDFVEVPVGDYEVSITKLELGETSEKSKNPGMPMAKVWFKILAGEFKGQLIFMNQVLTSGFAIHKMNGLMDSLESGITVSFENFQQYAELMKEVFDEIDTVGEYQLHYSENKKGFKEYKIIQRFK